LVRWDEKQFELVDTGGIVPDQMEAIPEQVFRQAELAIDESDLILLLVDVRSQLTPLDQELAALLKSKGKDFLVVANKVDVAELEVDSYEFYRLGVDSILPVSAEHKIGLDDLVEAIKDRIPEGVEAPMGGEIRVAIVGRPNVGKSSLLNCVTGKERVIVTSIPGTTRDSVDTVCVYQDQRYRIIDTAGIRRKGKTDQRTEKLSVVMARKNIERADVVLLVLDAVEGATKLDATIGGYAHDAGKSVIVVVNKWDLIEKDTFTADRMESEFRTHMRFLDYAPMLFVSAKARQRVFKPLQLAAEAHRGRLQRIGTAELNEFIRRQRTPALTSHDDPHRSLLKYSCQVGVAPPTFVLFTRGSRKLHFSTVRFLSNRLREEYGFFATPLRILQRPSRSKAGRKLASTP
jgi:GTP-binding protein